jgi:hypothetical protein
MMLRQNAFGASPFELSGSLRLTDFASYYDVIRSIFTTA